MVPSGTPVTPSRVWKATRRWRDETHSARVDIRVNVQVRTPTTRNERGEGGRVGAGGGVWASPNETNQQVQGREPPRARIAATA